MPGLDALRAHFIEDASRSCRGLADHADLQALEPDDSKFRLDGRGNDFVEVGNDVGNEQDLPAQQRVEDPHREVAVNRENQGALVLHPFPQALGPGLPVIPAALVGRHKQNIRLRHLGLKSAQKLRARRERIVNVVDQQLVAARHVTELLELVALPLRAAERNMAAGD